MSDKPARCTIPAGGMQTPAMLLAIVLFACTAVFGAAQENTSPKTLRVVSDNNYPPFIFHAADGTIQGILIDQWRLFEEKTGVRVEIEAMDWSDALKGMKAGRYDVIDTVFKTDERLGWLDFTTPYTHIEVPVFFSSDISGITGAESLKGFAVATKAGDAAIDYLKNHGIDNLLLFNSYEAVIQAARDRKVNVFVVDKPPALYFLHKYGIVDQFKQSPPLTIGEFHRAVKKGDSQTLQLIVSGFNKITEKELQQIDKKWYGSALSAPLHLTPIIVGAGLLLLLIAILTFWNRVLNRAVAGRTKALQASEARYRILFNAESDAIVVIDLQTLTHVEVNEAATKLYGYNQQELLALRAPDLSAEPAETENRITSGTGTVNIPLRYHRKKDGTVFPVEIAASYFDLDGRKLILAAMRDITVRRKAEDALRENRRFLRDLIENSGALIFVKDLGGRYTLINHKWEETTGLPRDLVIGKTDEELFPGDVGKQFRANDLAVIEAGEVQQQEEFFVDGSGRRTFLSIKFPLRSEDGAINGLCGMTTEITERKQAEEDREALRDQLLQSRKMESIGRLAGGIAHDFNNMLGVILGHTELALFRTPQENQLHGSLKEIEKAARRSANLTRQLLAFARKQTVVPRTIDLNETVDNLLNMLGRLVGEDISFVWSPADALWPVKMDPSQIDQILANLCANARDAIIGVGRITITTANTHIDEAFGLTIEGSRQGDFVTLSVTDDGCGMDSDTQTKLFEPFFTTKETGKGTGLGLATVYGIVRQNQGFITVDSAPGHGTKATIYLPRHNQLADVAPAKEESAPPTGTELILVVEDEPSILDMTCAMLTHLGYQILQAGSPQEAIEQAKRRGERIDLLMTDVIMPEMNGWEVAKILKNIHPEMKLLYTSGYPADTVTAEVTLEESIQFIQKPFTMQELSEKVREALSGAE